MTFQSEHQKLIEAARDVCGALSLAKPDLSAGSVGAALRTRSGAIHTGISLDMACGIGFCAEHAAVAEMLKHGEVEIGAIVAVTDSRILSPCGRCRELMIQLSPRNAATEIILSGGRVIPLHELLPEHWLRG